MFRKSGDRGFGQPTNFRPGPTPPSPFPTPRPTPIPWPKIPEAWNRLRGAAEFFYAMYLKRTGVKPDVVQITFRNGVPKIFVYPAQVFEPTWPKPTPPTPPPVPPFPRPPSPGVSGLGRPKVERTPRTGETYFHGGPVDKFNPYESF